MSSPDPFDLDGLSLAGPEGGAALALATFSLDDLLEELVQEVVPPSWPPPIAGGLFPDLSDIWDAVKRLVSFPVAMADWFWHLFYDTMQTAWKAAQWVWNLAEPAFLWTWGVTETWSRWVWDLVQPKFLWTWGVIDTWSRWVWDQVWPQLQWGFGVTEAWGRWVWDQVWPQLQWGFGVSEAWSRWVWDQVQPKFQWTWGVVQTWAEWLWDQVQPKFLWTWGVVETWARWVVDQLIGGADWIWDNVITRLDDLGSTVVNEAGALTETVINTGIQGAQAIGGGFQDALGWLFEHVFDNVADSIQVKMGIPRKLLTGQYTNPEQLLDDFEDPFSFGSVAAYALMVPGAILGLMGAASEAGSVLFEPAVQKAAQIGGHTIPSFTDLRDAYLRDLMDDEKHDDWLGRAGYSQTNIDIIKELYFDLPATSDLVRMAVREAFTPAVVERFGLHEDFPPDFAKYGRQAGLSDFWTKAHWAAHWDLPSATQGFQMYHRDVIDKEDLELLLRTRDVMPFWRDRMIEIAYRVISRIDVRRMYRTGVLDRDKVLRVYLDLGYTPEDAEALTEYVTREGAGVDKDAPRETIVAAYRDRLILRPEAETALAELDFTPEAIALFLDQADFALEKQNAALAEDIVEADFKAGAITEASARAELAELGIPPARVDLLIGLWSRKAAVRTLTLTGSQLLRLHREGLMEEATLRQRLSALGHNETDVDYLVQLAPPEPPAEPRTLSLAQTRNAFEDGLIDLAEFTSRLEVMGYPPEDVSILIDLAQPEELVQVRILTVSQLQRAFRQGVIDEAELRSRLAERGYSPAGVDVLVTLAQPEVAARARVLTVSQLQRAFRQGLLPEASLQARLQEMGYSAEAASLLVDLSRPPEEAPPRALSVAQLQRALRRELLTDAEVGVQLTALGYSAGAVPLLIALARPEELVKERDLTVAQDQKAFREGLITEGDLRGRLQVMGFSALDVDILVELALPEVS